VYPLFCQAESAIDPPACKDFACELKAVMPKKRINERKDGKRAGTETFDLVPHPVDNVIALDAPLLREADLAMGLTARVARRFRDVRNPAFVAHQLKTLVAQRIHGARLRGPQRPRQLRCDPALGLLSDTLEPKRDDVETLAGKSTLNRLEHGPLKGASRYHKISVDDAAMEQVFIDLFIAAHEKPPKRLIPDLDATDDPLHGNQEGRFFHGYYRCYCYLPLYIFCGRHLLVAKLRRANIDASAGAREEVARIVAALRKAWPDTEIWLRADSGFARDELMTWCEENRVDYVFGLARNERLEPMLGDALAEAPCATSRAVRGARSRMTAPGAYSTQGCNSFLRWCFWPLSRQFVAHAIGEGRISLEAISLNGGGAREAEHDRGKLQPGALYCLGRHIRRQFFPSTVESVEEDVRVGRVRWAIYQLASFHG
jgi:hypothetical protein